jgi:hypothetical protein
VCISLNSSLLQQFIPYRQIKNSGSFGPLIFVVSLAALHRHVKLALHKLTKSKTEDLGRRILLTPSSEWSKKSSWTNLNIMAEISSSTSIHVHRYCTVVVFFNPLNAELNPICHLLALLGGATIAVVSRLRVKLFCNVWVCVCVGFVMCGCVYVWDL